MPAITLARRALLAAGAAALAPRGAGAQPAYPDHSIRVVVPFAPGGPTDIMARLISVPLGTALGQPVVVENRPGAGGNIGIANVAHAPADGYNLLVTSSAFMVNPSLYRNAPYDAVRDFAPITELGTSPNIILIRPDLGITTLAELVARAKAQPGVLNYASAGSGTTPHLTGELLKLRAGIDLVHVPFNGAGPAIQAILSGTTELASVALPPALVHVRSGALRALAVSGATRWFDLPDVPTVQESGYPGFLAETVQALLAPAATPPAILDRLVRDSTAALRDPRMRDRLHEAGFEVLGGGPAALAARITAELPLWRDVVTRAHIVAD